MSRRAILTAIACVAVVAVGLGLYISSVSPRNLAEKAAHQFWVAVIAGDTETVESMLATEADFTTSQVIESYRESMRW